MVFPLIILTLLAWIAAAAPPGALSIAISTAALERDLQRIERDKVLPEAMREQIVAKYREALKSSRQAEFFAAEKLRHEQFDKQFGNDLAAVRSELQNVARQQHAPRTNFGTTEHLRLELADEQVNLQAFREALADLDRFTRLRMRRRNEIANRIAAVNQDLLRSEELQSSSSPPREISIGRANYVAALANRAAAQKEIQALRAELTGFDNHAEVTPLRRDLAEKRLAAAYGTVQALQAVLLQRTAADSEALRSLIQRQCLDAMRRFPSLRPLAEEVLEYVQVLASPKGVQVEADSSRQSLATARSDLAQLRRISRATRRKFLAAGIHRDSSQWFPEIPDSMPSMHAVREGLRVREDRISEIEHEIASLEAMRAKQGDIEADAATLPSRLKVPAASLSPDFDSRARQLLYTRRDLQGGLLTAYSHTLSALLELNSLHRSMFEEQQRLAEYVRERILWVKSVPGPAVPTWPQLRSATVWLATQPQWSATMANAAANVSEKAIPYSAVLLAICLPIALRRRIVRALTELPPSAPGGNFPPTLLAFLYTLLLALPLPAILFAAGRLIQISGQTRAAADGGAALMEVSLLALAIAFTIASSRKGGLAVKHLHWPDATARQVNSVLILAIAPILIAVLVHLAFGREAIHYVGSREQVDASNSMGRLAFVIAVACIYAATWKLLRPSGVVVDALTEHRPGEHRHWFRYVWLPVFSSVQLLVIVLAVSGYYLTAFVLMRRASLTVLIAAIVLLATSIVSQWRASHRKRLETLAAGIEPESEALAVRLADDQMKRLSQFVASALLLVLTYFVWSDLLPSLRILERVTLLPSMGFVTDKELAALAPPVVTAPSQPEASVAKTPPPSLPSPMTPMETVVQPQSPSPSTQAAIAKVDESHVTLSDLLSAILIIVVTILMAKDIPGPLQFLLRRPMPNAGDRNAVATIVKYIIVLIGLSSAARQFGLQWSQIQWLAAAFSFGIAFGLQEIFANFVSGIIILIERPMAVGDTCKFGSQVGTVEAIGLRSTRLRAADRTVIIVPNAEFSKREIVNYARRDRMLIQSTLQLRPDTTGEQLKSVLDGIHEVLLNHPRILKDPARVRFAGFAASSINVDIFAYADCRLGEEFLRIQEELFLQIMSVVNDAGTGLAPPPGHPAQIAIAN